MLVRKLHTQEISDRVSASACFFGKRTEMTES